MSSAGSWKLEIDADRVAWLTCDTPGTSTNVLSAAVLKDLAAALTQIAGQKPVGVVVGSAKPSGFVAGADIKEFLNIHTPEDGYSLIRSGQTVLDQLENLPCPTVAAVHGFALGGGFELALAADLSHRRRRRPAFARTAGGDARHSSGIRRHGAHGAPDRRSPIARSHAQGQTAQRRESASNSDWSISSCRRRSSRRPRNGCCSRRRPRKRRRSSRSC